MAWGTSLSQGVVVNNRFAHPDLAIALELPSGWKVDNNPRFLEARDPKGSALIQIGVIPREKNESASAALKRMTRNNKLEVEEMDDGATAKANVNVGDGKSQPARISAIPLDKKLMLTVVGTASDKEFNKVDKQLLATNASFEHLDDAQVAAIKAPRLRVIPRGDQSFKTLAAESAIEYDAINILRLLNRSFPSGNIKKLDTVKTVILDDPD
jgi:predicted Zn-dependent protease